MGTPANSARLPGRSESNSVGPKGPAVSVSRAPSARSGVLAGRILGAEIRAESGKQIVARKREIAIAHASAAETIVIKTATEVGGVSSAPSETAGLFAHHRIRRQCRVVVESDTFFKIAVIGGGFLSVILAITALLSVA